MKKMCLAEIGYSEHFADDQHIGTYIAEKSRTLEITNSSQRYANIISPLKEKVICEHYVAVKNIINNQSKLALVAVDSKSIDRRSGGR